MFISKDKIVKALGKLKGQADALLADDEKMDSFLKDAETKLARIPKVGKDLANVPLLIEMLRSYKKGEYRRIPSKSIKAIAAALIYFVIPTDLIPDWIPVAGMADDAAVLAYVWSKIKDDAAEYKKWQVKSGKAEKTSKILPVRKKK